MDNMDNNWKKWIFENLVRGVNNNIILEILIKNKIDKDISMQFIYVYSDIINNNIIDINSINNNNNERNILVNDWISKVKCELLSYTKSNLLLTELNELINWNTFLEKFYSQNKPVIIRNQLLDDCKNITIDYLSNTYDNFDIEIQKGRTKTTNYEIKSNHLKSKMGFLDYLNGLTTVENDIYLTANNNGNKNIKKIKNDILKMLIKDQSPWTYLNNEYDENSYLWIGGKGIKTPYHYDLTNNLFVQIQGQKEFTIIPSDQISYMYNNNHVYTDIPSFDYSNEDLNKFKNFNKVKSIKFILNPGDILFIPIGWYHKVKGLSNSISLSFINFNTVNNFNNSYPK